jgi:hypothetical protein
LPSERIWNPPAAFGFNEHSENVGLLPAHQRRYSPQKWGQHASDKAQLWSDGPEMGFGGYGLGPPDELKR